VFFSKITFFWLDEGCAALRRIELVEMSMSKGWVVGEYKRQVE
jgi:hypothetical protein